MDTGNTAWILTSTALVLFMTLPGLALFYGGLVRAKNLLSVLIQCLGIACVVSILWFAFGYSIAFAEGNAYWGGLGKMFLKGVGVESASGDLPETVFFMFQMTFAIITPALIVGAYVERIKFGAVLLFSGLWLLLVYAPITHWIWGGGWLASMGIQDFAGGLVVHLNCGMAALVVAHILGARKGFPNETEPPHSPPLALIGTAMLWVGWFGFNAGSALAADANAGMAMTVTHISAATAALVWMFIEMVKHGKPTIVGMATGCIAGLATITPASGFVGPIGALILGILAGVGCYWMVGVVKSKFGIDDTLDVFAVHGIGGVIGTLLVAVLGDTAFGGLGLSEIGIYKQLGVQITGIIAIGLWSGVVSYILIKITASVVGLRASSDEELQGLDQTVHGESAYHK